jgi:hypothetical protein
LALAHAAPPNGAEHLAGRPRNLPRRSFLPGRGLSRAGDLGHDDGIRIHHSREVLPMRALLIVSAVAAGLASACSDSAGTCSHQGRTYAAGESFPAGDGCNTCSCDPRTLSVGCTEKACPPPPGDGGPRDGGPRDGGARDGRAEGARGDALPSGIPFSTVGMGTGAATSFPAQFNRVLGDDGAWKDLLAKLSGTASASVDFASEQVLAVGLGIRGSGGYAVEVKRVDLVAGVVQVSYLETTPGEGCAVPAVMTAPWHAVKIAKQTAPIRFVMKKVQAPACQTLPPAPCATEKAAVFAELERINHCLAAEDCVAELGSCPFGCVFFREKSESTSKLQALIQAHDATCGACSYKCAPPPTAAEILCVGSVCQKLLTGP